MAILQKLAQVRSLSRAINAATKLLTERGEANSVSMANEILSQYKLLSEDQKISFYQALATKFNPNPELVLKVAQDYAKDPNAKNLIQLTKVTEPPRQELLRRINRVEGATKEIVVMRRHLIKVLGKKPELYLSLIHI